MISMYNWKRKAFWSIVILLLIYGGFRLYYRLTDDFRIANITYDQSYNPQWDIPKLSLEEHQKLKLILNQKFFYIDKGAQSYAFKSQDGNYVLKFFKFKHLRPHWFLQMLPSIGPIKTYQQKQLKRKDKNLKGVFAGYKIGYDLDREQSGLIFIHLNKSSELYQRVIIVDKIGHEHFVDLDSNVFILQKRAEQFKNLMDHLLASKKLDIAKERIGQIFELYFSEYQKGIYDRDHGIMHNVGFIGIEPIHLDVGKMSKHEPIDDPQFYKNDFKMVIFRMKNWLKANYPHDFQELSLYIDQKSTPFFNEST